MLTAMSCSLVVLAKAQTETPSRIHLPLLSGRQGKVAVEASGDQIFAQMVHCGEKDCVDSEGASGLNVDVLIVDEECLLGSRA